jgi:cysteine dioxygenase
MTTGQIPDLWEVCFALLKTFDKTDAPFNAMQFLPALQHMEDLDEQQVKRFMKNRENRHVLVSNEIFEVVLNLWKPGRVSDIHGHPDGGCLFKLLHGKLEEVRYTHEKKPRLMSMSSLRKESIAYIDDRIAYHQVGNPYGSTAISLHVYLK